METISASNGLTKGKAKEGTAAFLIELEKQRAIKVETYYSSFTLTDITDMYICSLKIHDWH